MSERQAPGKLWLWKNFVDGRPEYWAFDNPFPTYDGGDPMVLGGPCGYAVFKESTLSPRRAEYSEAEVLAAIDRARPSVWHPIEGAPKDGTRILAYGQAYPELAENGRWFTADTSKPRVPYTMILHWVEGWYDKEIDLGNGTYTKERTQGYAHWAPEAHAFNPTHWQPLPEPPQ